MINIVCLKVGTKYGPEYVNRLYKGVFWNLSYFDRFICITDDPEGIKYRAEVGSTSPPIEIIPPEEPWLEGWWHKLTLFKPLAGIKGRIIFLDLDTVITGEIDFLADYDGPFSCLDDFYHPGHLQSSIMLMQAGTLQEIWKQFSLESEEYMRMHSDQEVIEHFLYQWEAGPDLLQKRFPDKIVSYKVHCQNGLPAGARIVCFHGIPRPHEADAAWIQEHWRE